MFRFWQIILTIIHYWLEYISWIAHAYVLCFCFKYLFDISFVFWILLTYCFLYCIKGKCVVSTSTFWQVLFYVFKTYFNSHMSKTQWQNKTESNDLIPYKCNIMDNYGPSCKNHALGKIKFFWVFKLNFSSVQLLSHVRLFATPWIAAGQASLSITNSQSSLRLASIKSVMPSSHLILGRPLLLLPSIPTSIKVFSNVSTLHMRWPKYWSFSFSIIPSKELSGLISFRMDWLDLLAVQGTVKSLLQHHCSKASILQCSAFFTVQLSHLYMTTGKTIALTRRTLVGN